MRGWMRRLGLIPVGSGYLCMFIPKPSFYMTCDDMLQTPSTGLIMSLSTYLLSNNPLPQRLKRPHHLPQPLWTKDPTLMPSHHLFQFRIRLDEKVLCFFQQIIDIGARGWNGTNIWWNKFLCFPFLGWRGVGGFGG